MSAYVEPYALWSAIENRNDPKAASLARYNIRRLLEMPGGKRVAPVTRAAENGLYETVKVALEAGLSPHDLVIFRRSPLLGLHMWYSQPKHCELALKHGASPDTQVPDSIDLSELTMSVSRYLATRIHEEGDREPESVTDMRIESLALILAAGTTTADVDPLSPTLSAWSASAAWLIASTTSQRAGHYERHAVLVPLLKAAGCDIDTPCGFRGSNAMAPVVAAIRNRNQPVAEAFIMAGARIDDEHLVREAASGSAATHSLFDEVDEAFGVGGGAWAREAVMRRRTVEAQDVGVPHTAPVSRRRMRI